MTIVGCDFHPGWQQVAVFDAATGEIRELKLSNSDGEAERFYRQLGPPALVGFEASGNTQWFEDLLDELGHEVWIGDAAAIRASYVRKQKTDRRDAAHILKLLIEHRFPRLWRPSAEERDLRQLLIHRHKLVSIRARAKNGLHHLMLNRGVQMKRKLWSVAGQRALRELPLEGWAAQRRKDLLSLLAGLNQQVTKLDEAVLRAAEQNARARLLMTQPGVGPITALAFVVTMGDVSRFQRGKQVGSYLGLIPRERSSSNRRRLGSISKQGNPFLRMLLVESAQTVNRLDEGFRKQYKQRCHRMAKGVAKVAAARRLSRATLLDAAYQHSISGDRSHREQPEVWCGRRKLDREIEWALSHPAQAGCSYGKSWSQLGPHRWMVKRSASPQVIRSVMLGALGPHPTLANTR
jgi:transposase